jgi:2-polyprenyl-6-methoxyphenol hydroxylase-like FAD-dependent oxidoreductase
VPAAGRYDLVAGFDGTRSAVRRHLFGDRYEPRPTGFPVWRMSLPSPPELDRGLYGYANFHSTPTASNAPSTPLRHFMQTTVNLRHISAAEPNPYSRAHVSESIRCDKRLPTNEPFSAAV